MFPSVDKGEIHGLLERMSRKFDEYSVISPTQGEIFNGENSLILRKHRNGNKIIRKLNL